MLILKIISLFLPWKIRRIYLNVFFGYKIHHTAKIGLAWIFPTYLEIGKNSVISHFTIAIHLEKLVIGEESIINRGNWITGSPLNANNKHFTYKTDRKPELIIGSHSAITKNHHIDCTDLVLIGDFVTIAGYNSVILTHSINIYENRQDCDSIIIEDYTFIGTGCTILPGSRLPAYSVLGAQSLLNKNYTQNWTLYAGVPAKPVKMIDNQARYFSRSQGIVY